MFLSLLFLSNESLAQNDVLDKEISITFTNLSLKESLEKIESELGIPTAYNEKELNDDKLTISFDKELLSEVLEALLTNKKLTYKIIGNTIAVYEKEDTVVQKETTIPSKKTAQTAPPIKVKNYTLSGYVLDAESKEALIGANVFVPKLKLGVSTNEYGFYSLTLPEDDYEISFSYIGYQTLIEQFLLKKNLEFTAALYVGNQLDEIVVTDETNKVRHAESKMSSNKLSMEKLESMPVLMGERDVLKLVQLMPGIQSGSEGSTGLYVRGGGPDQNLILLDGVPIYNVNHLFGFLSTLNGDAIKSAEVIKGGFPARHGGRLSSILDIRMKEGDMENFHGNISLGLVSGKFNLEGPIVKNKTSFHISGRRTWLDVITTPIQKSIKHDGGRTIVTKYHFYDLNAKVNHKFSDKSRLFFSSYLGNDKLEFNEEDPTFNFKFDGKLKWGNRISSLRWNYQITPKLFTNTTVYNSNYKFNFNDEETNGSADNPIYKRTFNSRSDINDIGAKLDFNYLPNPKHYFRAGLGLVHHQFNPSVNSEKFQTGSQAPVEKSIGDPQIKSNELTAYVEDDFSLGSRLKINAGLHLAGYLVESSEYFSLQPRAALSFLLSERSSIKMSYSKMTQFLHLLASPGLGFPTDLWVTSTDRVKPEHSIQYALAYTQSLNKGYEVTGEIYYKTMENLLEYKSGFDIFSSSQNWQDKILVGTGKSYGLELLLEKTKGKITGWIGYTLSKSDRNFPDLDQGNTFPYKYDRRHDLSIAITHKKSERVDFGLIWVYGTGNTYTLGTNNYYALTAGEQVSPDQSIYTTLEPVNHIENRNNQRAPAYHRLDLSVNLHKEKNRGKRTWSFGLYNAYSRQNPFLISLEKRRTSDQLYLKQTSLLPVIPFIAYSFKF